jgi:hypothetical protein
MNIQNLSDLDWSVRVRFSTILSTSSGTDLKKPVFFSFLYSIQLVLSSDKLSNRRQGILLLRLTSVDYGGVMKETLLEFDASEMVNFLGHLKDAKQVRLLESEVTLLAQHYGT